MLKAILVIAVLFLILRLVSKPRIIVNVGDMEKRIREEERKKWEQEYKRREGEIKVDYIPEKKKNEVSSGSKSGDYVDFEEVK